MNSGFMSQINLRHGVHHCGTNTLFNTMRFGFGHNDVYYTTSYSNSTFSHTNTNTTTKEEQNK